MTRAILVGGTIVVAVVLSLGFAGFLTAQTPSSSALTGKVTSQADGAREGVLIGAKKVGSTISIWVVSNAQGQYSFPREGMGPGTYNIRIRAVGYQPPKTSSDVTPKRAHWDSKPT